MAEARGEKIVMSAPRSRRIRSWFVSMLSAISSSEIVRDTDGARSVGVERRDLRLAPEVVGLGRRRVVTVTVDDHASGHTAEGTKTSPRIKRRAVRSSAA